jgi:hypothetical protein
MSQMAADVTRIFARKYLRAASTRMSSTIELIAKFIVEFFFYF